MKKAIRITAVTLASIIACVLLLVIVYVMYVVVQYYRIDDNIKIEGENNQEIAVKAGEEYSISTFNIGFGAYDHDFDFFLDSGEMKDGEKVSGSGSRAKDKQTAIDNVQGCIDGVKYLGLDFMFFQEVDINATRSYEVNQYQMLKNDFPNYSYQIAENFHSAYLMYPLHSFHGATTAGIATLSKYNVAENVRRSFPVDESFPNKFFDLDRCFMISRLPIENSDKQLTLINIHMSAYDEGGKIRQKQLAMLNEVLKTEREKGNYVVAGGDFNHNISGSDSLFESQQKVPQWVNSFSNEDLTDGFEIACAVNVPTCRSTDMPYEKGKNYTVVIDGFIVSDNIKVVETENIDLDFANSDHNPAKLTFELV